MKFANPAPLGLAGFALTTWLLSLINTGFLGEGSMPLILATAFAFGGTAQFFAGLLEYPRGNTFGFVAFCSFGAFWWSFALFVEFFAKGVSADVVGWYLCLWGFFTLYMWFASLRLNRAVQFVFLFLFITFFVLGAGDFTGLKLLTHIGGYLGLVTAACAFYLSAAEVINETHDRTRLPTGPYAPLD